MPTYPEPPNEQGTRPESDGPETPQPPAPPEQPPRPDGPPHPDAPAPTASPEKARDVHGDPETPV
jgi:hypothetical protein